MGISPTRGCRCESGSRSERDRLESHTDGRQPSGRGLENDPCGGVPERKRPLHGLACHRPLRWSPGRKHSLKGAHTMHVAVRRSRSTRCHQKRSDISAISMHRFSGGRNLEWSQVTGRAQTAGRIRLPEHTVHRDFQASQKSKNAALRSSRRIVSQKLPVPRIDQIKPAKLRQLGPLLAETHLNSTLPGSSLLRLMP